MGRGDLNFFFNYCLKIDTCAAVSKTASVQTSKTCNLQKMCSVVLYNPQYFYWNVHFVRGV